MILGVDAHRLLGPRGGVARVLEALLRHLSAKQHPFEEIRLYTPAPLDDPESFGPRTRNWVIPGPSSPGLWQQLALPRAHRRTDLLLCPGYTLPLLARAPMLLIHHGSYEGCAEAFPLRRRLSSGLAYGLSAWRADTVITVSEHSRRQMMRFYRLPARKIRVIPNGIDTELFRPEKDVEAADLWRRKTLGDERPFVLYVGHANPRRRLPELVEAFARLRARRELTHRLVFIGFELTGTALAETVERCGVSDAVIALGHREHREVALAYQGAEVMVYPSIDEGFGLPVLEAMACGTPTIALDRAAFPEFAAGVALLLADARIETLEKGLEAVLCDPERRERMRRAGPRRAADYRWTELGERYLREMSRLVRRAGAET